MIRTAVVALSLAIVPLAVMAQTVGNERRWGVLGPGTKANLARHQRVLLMGVPDPYRSVRDPYPMSDARLLRGQAIFAQSCAGCHGSQGQGNGFAAQVLNTAPASLGWLAQTPQAKSDPYMYWSIEEGGAAFNSDMPAFKTQLKREDVWAVISYVRAGTPHTG